MFRGNLLSKMPRLNFACQHFGAPTNRANHLIFILLSGQFKNWRIFLLEGALPPSKLPDPDPTGQPRINKPPSFYSEVFPTLWAFEFSRKYKTAIFLSLLVGLGSGYRSSSLAIFISSSSKVNLFCENSNIDFLKPKMFCPVQISCCKLKNVDQKYYLVRKIFKVSPIQEVDIF